MNLCEHCGTNRVKVYFNMEEKSLQLCNDCYNEIMAEDLEVDLEHLLESFTVEDHQGISRTFLIERRLYPNGIYLEAIENIEYGYKFAVDGKLDCNQQELLQRLIHKTQNGTARRQINTGVFPNGQRYHSISHDRFIGIIEYDETSNGTPLLLIDGKPFSWEEVGKMLMSYEGFQIKMELYDYTDDVE